MSAPREILPVEPGYYIVQPQRFSLGEFQRLSGRGIYGYVVGLFRSFMNFSANSAFWMPTYWNETLATPEEISERGMDAILPTIAEFERLGFRLVYYQKATNTIGPGLVDNSGATLFHSSGEFIANVIHQELLSGKTVLTVAVGFSCSSGIRIGVTNTGAYFDVVRPSRVIALPDASTARLWQQVRQERDVLVAQGETIVIFQNPSQWERTVDEQLRELSHDRVNVRKIYRKLTDKEVEMLLQHMDEQQR